MTHDVDIWEVQAALVQALRQARRRRWVVRAAVVVATLVVAAGFLYRAFT